MSVTEQKHQIAFKKIEALIDRQERDLHVISAAASNKAIEHFLAFLQPLFGGFGP
jgi:hypothetical protein